MGRGDNPLTAVWAFLAEDDAFAPAEDGAVAPGERFRDGILRRER